MPTVVGLREGGDVIAHGSSAVVYFWSAAGPLLHVDVLAEEVEPGAGAMAVGGSSEAVTYGLETFFGKVAWDVEYVEEFNALRKGVSAGQIKRSKAWNVSLSLIHGYLLCKNEDLHDS
ncbi:hypothetical protein HG531_007429 [Fusarium graminearum]|nr:hypothetical protein HG531_007429 [Fusarium graminearum]